MRRRAFLKKIPLAAGAPLMLNGIPIQVLGKGQLQQAIAGSTNDKVLVLIQMRRQ